MRSVASKTVIDNLVVTLKYLDTPLQTKCQDIVLYVGNDVNRHHPSRQMDILAQWDDDAKVWAASNDEMGVATATYSHKHWEADLKVCVPELLELNGLIPKKRKANRAKVLQSKDQFHDRRPCDFADRQNWNSRGGGYGAKR